MTWILRLLRMPCGEFGGQLDDGRTRWCVKRFGHSDSCAYEFGHQPLAPLRLRAKGWR